MRKLSLLMGALGGALAGYLISNDQLREELGKAKTSEDAAKLLGKHLQKDGKKVMKEVQQFAKSPVVTDNYKKAKKFATEKYNEVSKNVQSFVKEGSKKAGSAMKSTAKTAAKKGKKPGNFKDAEV
jgi:hypothetical protein